MQLKIAGLPPLSLSPSSTKAALIVLLLLLLTLPRTRNIAGRVN
jgi:hypothetical protein